jgi:hypothetical protein
MMTDGAAVAQRGKLEGGASKEKRRRVGAGRWLLLCSILLCFKRKRENREREKAERETDGEEESKFKFSFFNN